MLKGSWTERSKQLKFLSGKCTLNQQQSLAQPAEMHNGFWSDRATQESGPSPHVYLEWLLPAKSLCLSLMPCTNQMTAVV